MRMIWLALGTASLGLGGLGAVLPLLPTTPFVLLAACFFSRSSPALHDWLVSHPVFGTAIRDWQEQRAISRRGKIAAAIAIGLTMVLSLATGVGLPVLLVQTVVLCGALVFVLTRRTAA